MNMPGFNAEASLYKTSEHFQMVAGQEGFAEQTVVPQNLNRCYWVRTCTLFLCACRKVCCSDGSCHYTGAWAPWVGQC